LRIFDIFLVVNLTQKRRVKVLSNMSYRKLYFIYIYTYISSFISFNKIRKLKCYTSFFDWIKIWLDLNLKTTTSFRHVTHAWLLTASYLTIIWQTPLSKNFVSLKISKVWWKIFRKWRAINDTQKKVMSKLIEIKI